MFKTRAAPEILRQESGPVAVRTGFSPEYLRRYGLRRISGNVRAAKMCDFFLKNKDVRVTLL